MGAPMCRRLVHAGYDVVAFDIDAAALAAVTSGGAVAAESAAACAGEADLLLTSLPRPDHVASVMREGGALAAMRSGSMWIDLTTNRKELVVELAGEAPVGVH